MIFNSQLVEKLRELGFHFDTSSKRAHTYKKKGATTRVTFNTRDQYEDRDARSHVVQAGMNPADAQVWVTQLSQANAAPPAPPAP
ncbi:MAG: hypothetical protein Q8N18_26985 [Opitutaceae bacterium]|nr:hypothetical protein [Opitutaceae bacterium]